MGTMAEFQGSGEVSQAPGETNHFEQMRPTGLGRKREERGCRLLGMRVRVNTAQRQEDTESKRGCEGEERDRGR